MKIPNYDKNKNGKQNRKLNNFLDEDYRMLITGQSKCGKTNTLMHILRTPLFYYDKIYLYTRNQHQDKIQDLEKITDKISDKVSYPVLEIGLADDIKDTSEYPDNSRKVVIFDDLVNEPEKIQNKIANHFTDGRHHKISPIYLTQSYYGVPQKLRQNCSHVILYTPTTKNHSSVIARENLIEPSLFNKLGPYEFLFLDWEYSIILISIRMSTFLNILKILPKKFKQVVDSSWMQITTMI